ncbi:hypothetical protein SAMN05444354_116117 [Stigmatella aurantiaca]|uniref:Uncharacterized protein n=1 Tax=Stigmatella aurantiaca TaxID=41 RepID=A0A1H7Y767_STIAU|nr:hypothetical protein [Stigmatella aurantiaca]SEM41765.1 hypothetical protein SAMN05444354_116117 [Stigmatella aurantiaca]
MVDWTPKPNLAVDLKRLSLSAEEGFVLSRLDGGTAASHLPALTGLPPERLQAILQRLVEQGALQPPPSAQRAAAAPASPPPSQEPPEVSEAPEDEEPLEAQANHRQLFETRLHPLDENTRQARAHAAEEPELSAFCFDPVPAVIKAVLENPRVGLGHARLIVRHHRHPVGLEAVCAKAAFAADGGVRRWLVRNPQLPGGLFRRLWSTRRLMELHKVMADRDIPEGTRRTARELLRQRFNSGPSEEKVELILHTEGRCLLSLSGLPVDGKTASLLCGRPYRSSLLIQNIARWTAAPPALIAHLLKQDAVRQQPQLRMLLARHPHAPADARQNER